ncbi:MAG: NADH-quinone oxidoreductase subunit J [Clostridia bacterium]|nr:NADH-quinone oxidoreductase subunit J [Clostridia bacterium]
MSWAWVGFAVLTGAAVFSALRVVLSPSITHAALHLAIVLVAVAGYFLLLQSEFLAVVQVLVYVGAVMTVIIFAIMLSDLPLIRGGAGLRAGLGSERFGWLPLLVACGVGALVLVGYGSVVWTAAPLAFQESLPMLADTTGQGTTGLIGRALFTSYLVPFEVASLLLLAALVGAIVLTRREVAVRVRELPKPVDLRAVARTGRGPAGPKAGDEADAERASAGGEA